MLAQTAAVEPLLPFFGIQVLLVCTGGPLPCRADRQSPARELWVPAGVNYFQSFRIILFSVAHLFKICLTQGEWISYATNSFLNCFRSVISVGFQLITTLFFFQEEPFSFLKFSSLGPLYLHTLNKHFPFFYWENHLSWLNTSSFSPKKSLFLNLFFVSRVILFVSVIFANVQLMVLLLITVHIATLEMGELPISLPNPGVPLIWA